VLKQPDIVFQKAYLYTIMALYHYFNHKKGQEILAMQTRFLFVKQQPKLKTKNGKPSILHQRQQWKKALRKYFAHFKRLGRPIDRGYNLMTKYI